MDVPTERLRELFGVGTDDIFRGILPSDIIEREGIRNLGLGKECLYRSIYSPVIPMAGLTDLLAEMRRCGILSAVASSGPEANVSYVLREGGLEKYFDAVVNGEMVARRKPDPDVFLKSAELYRTALLRLRHF